MESARTRKRLNPFRLAVLLSLLAVLGLFYVEQRQMRLSEHLIRAVIDGETQRVNDLLISGADPNSRMVGLGLVPDTGSIWERILRILRIHPRTREIRGRPVLYQAIISEHPHIVQLLLKHGADVHGRPGNTEPPIVRAVTTNNMESVRHMIDAGADLNARSREGESLLMRAATHSRPGIVELLLDRGANVNDFDKHNRSPLRIAAERRSSKVITLLLRNGARVSDIGLAGPIMPSGINQVRVVPRGMNLPPISPLVVAAQSGSAELVRAAWNAMGRPNLRQSAMTSDYLRYAVQSGSVESVGALLELGVPIRDASGRNRSALNSAIGIGNVEMVEFLISRGASITRVDDSGYSPLHMAAAFPQANLVKLLLKHGADPAVMNQNTGQLPLHMVMTLESAKALLDNPRTKIDSRDFDGKTPLMTVGQPNVQSLLIDRGADVNARDHLGVSVLLHAVRSRNESMVRDLLNRGADPRVPDNTGNTPLVEAARSNFPGLRQAVEAALSRSSITTKS